MIERRFQQAVEAAIRQVDGWLNLPPEETDWQQVGEDCRGILEALEQKALLAGLPGAVRACQVRGGSASVQQTRQALAACLGAINAEKESEPSIPAVDPVLLTVRQAAERYNLGERTLYRLLQEGELQNYGPGTSKRIKPDDLERYLERYLERQGQPAKTGSSLFD